MFCCAREEQIKTTFHRFFVIFTVDFDLSRKSSKFGTKIANLTWKEKPNAKVLLGFGFFMKSFTDFLDYRLRFLTLFRDGSKFRLDNHLKL